MAFITEPQVAPFRRHTSYGVYEVHVIPGWEEVRRSGPLSLFASALPQPVSS